MPKNALISRLIMTLRLNLLDLEKNMKRLMFLVLCLVGPESFGFEAKMVNLLNAESSQEISTYQFTIPTADGAALLSGQVDYPPFVSGPIPLIVMIGGTGLFDRDYNFGNSGTEKDLLFKELSKEFTKAGFAVARYDFRGVHCSEFTMPSCLNCKSKDEIKQHFVNSCVNNKERASITWDNMEMDFVAVYNHVKKLSKIDSSKIIVFAHSEGTAHISNLISSKLIDPKGLMMMGMIAESPRSVIRWQFTSRWATQFLRAIDPDFVDKVTNEQIESFCRRQSTSKGDCDEWKSPNGYWTADSLAAVMESREYLTYREEALSHNDNQIFKHLLSEYGATFASYAWWKRWFLDDVQNIEKLARYKGPISVFNGEIDGATPAVRQFKAIDDNAYRFELKPNVYKYPFAGHSLSPHPFVGPIPEAVKADLVSAAQKMADIIPQ